jgi:hypothetical protein
MGKEDQKSSSMARPPPLLLHPLPYLLSHPNIQNLLIGASPSTGNGRKRANLCPFQLSDLREIKKRLDSILMHLTNTFKPLPL